MVHIYNRILFSYKRREIEPVVVMWMDLEAVIQSEVSQKEKNKNVLMNIYMESRKMVMINLSAWKE